MFSKVIVLILSYNGKDLLKDSISSYLSNDYENFEVVVIDNGSTDDTKSFVELEWPKISLLRTEKNLGYSGGFNFGLKYAFKEKQADFVLITNNDVKSDSRAISELVKVAKKNSMIGFVTGKVFYFDKPNVLQTVGKKEDPVLWNGGHIGHREIDKGQYDSIQERDFIDDIFMLVSKDLYFKIGGYDTEFFLQYEDFDWQARAKKKGFKIFYTPFAKIWHKESMTIGKMSFRTVFYVSRNHIVVVLKHKEKSFLKPFFISIFKNKLIKATGKHLIKGKFDACAAIWLGFFSALGWGLKNRFLR